MKIIFLKCFFIVYLEYYRRLNYNPRVIFYSMILNNMKSKLFILMLFHYIIILVQTTDCIKFDLTSVYLKYEKTGFIKLILLFNI